jgi:hypothetical protein
VSLDLREHISREHTQFHRVDRRELDELAGAHDRMHARYPRHHGHAHGPDGAARLLPPATVELPAWVCRLPARRLGKLSVYLSHARMRLMDADDWNGAKDLEPWGDAVWKLWQARQWPGSP